MARSFLTHTPTPNRRHSYTLLSPTPPLSSFKKIRLTRATQRCSIRLCRAASPIDDLPAAPALPAAGQLPAGSELHSELGLFLGSGVAGDTGSREPQATQMQLLPLTWGRR